MTRCLFRGPPVRPGPCRYWVVVLVLVTLLAPRQAGAAVPVEDWLDVVRGTPYWASQGVAHNLATIRRWVLLDESYCSESGRQILFDHRGRFLGYIDNADTVSATVDRLNAARERMANQQRVDTWSPGSETTPGYPFALACDQPHVNMDEAVARMSGSDKDYRLWGTWDGMRVGSADKPVSLVSLIRTVHSHLEDQGRISLPDGIMTAFVGEAMIESGGNKHALSTAAARGIMQLKPDVLSDCEIPEDFRLHRMAQVECALRLVDQNDHNLREPFDQVFGGLPEKKRAALYRLLLIQAYQIGVGRTIELLQGEQLGRAARYFAAHADRFSAADIQVGMIYHNLGRRDIGMMTLYYVSDVRIASEALCAARGMQGDPWCTSGAK